MGVRLFPCTLSFVLKNALKCIFFQKSLEVQKLSVTLHRFKCVFHSNRFLGLLTRESRQSFLYMKIKILHRPESLIIEGRFFSNAERELSLISLFHELNGKNFARVEEFF